MSRPPPKPFDDSEKPTLNEQLELNFHRPDYANSRGPHTPDSRSGGQRSLTDYPGFEPWHSGSEMKAHHPPSKVMPKLDKPTPIEVLVPFYEVDFAPH
jgi:hypothetical protein